MKIVRKVLSVAAVAALLSTSAFAFKLPAVKVEEVTASPKMQKTLSELTGKEITRFTSEAKIAEALKEVETMSENYQADWFTTVEESRKAEKSVIASMKVAKGASRSAKDFGKALIVRLGDSVKPVVEQIFAGSAAYVKANKQALVGAGAFECVHKFTSLQAVRNMADKVAAMLQTTEPAVATANGIAYHSDVLKSETPKEDHEATVKQCKITKI
ncbi:MAG: hypothetical protein H6622_07325 [Halobacteriovoraceae bacterium]|nr:hypothetical protein [Halobacteriovoraceae bacterium]